MVKGMNDIIEAWERVGIPEKSRKEKLVRRFLETAAFCAFVGGFIGFVLFELLRKGNM